jgi:hypothetical protein
LKGALLQIILSNPLVEIFFFTWKDLLKKALEKEGVVGKKIMFTFGGYRSLNKVVWGGLGFFFGD